MPTALSGLHKTRHKTIEICRHGLAFVWRTIADKESAAASPLDPTAAGQISIRQSNGVRMDAKAPRQLTAAG
jgi:hypothetical protein